MRRSKPKLRSVWVFHVDAGACNGCDIEILDVLTPFYDVERFGIKLVPTPRQADALLVTGSVNRQTVIGLKRVYDAMPPKPRIVVAVGSCAIAGGIFYDSLSVYGGVDKVLPVHLYIPGCPPRPEAILFGLGQLLGLVNKKVRAEKHVVKEPLKDRGYRGLLTERIYKDIRFFLTRFVGYFDRDQILEDLCDILREARSINEAEQKLLSKAFSVEDPRLKEVYLVASGFVVERLRRLKK